MKIYLMAILFVLSCKSYGQNDDLSVIVSKIFFDEEIYKRVFYTHNSDRKFAFIFCNTLLQQQYPGIMEDIQRNRFKVNYIERKDGSVIIIGDAFYNSEIDLFVVFDHIEIISNKKASLEFHTSSLYERKKMLDRYVKVKCNLRWKKDRWDVDHIRIKASKCCDKILGEIEIEN